MSTSVCTPAAWEWRQLTPHLSELGPTLVEPMDKTDPARIVGEQPPNAADSLAIRAHRHSPSSSIPPGGESETRLLAVVRRDNAESDEFGARDALQSSGAGSEADYGESGRIRVHELRCEE
jgi:hypothetical protein